MRNCKRARWYAWQPPSQTGHISNARRRCQRVRACRYESAIRCNVADGSRTAKRFRFPIRWLVGCLFHSHLPATFIRTCSNPLRSPADSSIPTEPPVAETVPAPDPPDERCAAAGGLWTGGECDMHRPGCVAKGGTWNVEQGVCHGRIEVSCPEGTVLKGEACVSSPVRAPVCEGEVTSDGRCVPKRPPAPAPFVSSAEEGGSSLPSNSS